MRARLAGFATPIEWPNESFTPPADGSAFIAVQFPIASEEQASFGAPESNVFREEGAVRFVICSPRGEGVDPAAALADQLRDLFRNARFGGVRTYAPTSPVFDGRGDDGNYHRASFAVPYEHDIFA
ncbi:hypothetical protein ASE61_15065 [Bosea sp. Root670]|nr:hypothetical protein ASE61_15065 [Bosea sp. Root670]